MEVVVKEGLGCVVGEQEDQKDLGSLWEILLLLQVVRLGSILVVGHRSSP